jgi:hypothetical protein
MVELVNYELIIFVVACGYQLIIYIYMLLLYFLPFD